MTGQEIKTHIVAMVQAAYPGVPIYEERVPATETRPALLLETFAYVQMDMNFAMVQRQLTLHLRPGRQEDDPSGVSPEELLALFEKGRLHVQGRTISMTISRGLAPQGRHIALDCTWCDDRDTDRQEPVSMQDLQLAL